MLNLWNEPQQEYLGKGLSFPLELNVQGQLKLSTEAQKVKESIFIILSTPIGHRVYRPNFGCRLSSVNFEPLNANTMLQIRSCVLEALQTWEPRIIVNEVRTDADQVRACLYVTINYQLKNYPVSDSLVYPFDLDSTSE